MNARWIGSDIDTCEKLTEPGDIGIGAENYHHSLMVNCPICHRLHVVDIIGSTYPNPRWTWDQSSLTASPSYKLTHHTGAVCHWNITNGEWVIHGDSTATPGEGELKCGWADCEGLDSGTEGRSLPSAPLGNCCKVCRKPMPCWNHPASGKAKDGVAADLLRDMYPRLAAALRGELSHE